MIFRGHFTLFLLYILVLNESQAQTVVPDFTVPSSVCVGDNFIISNNTTGGTTFKWNFCSKDLNQAPAAQAFGNFGGLLDQPTYIDVAFDGANYYAFITQFGTGNLIRLDFGNSLLNNPAPKNLGNVNGAIPSGGNGGIQVVQNEGKWYAIIVSGYPPGGVNPRITKIEFGSNITNLNPVGTNWGNIGNMYDPNDLVLVKEGNVWMGLTVNGETNTISRFDFGTSFDNFPTGVNLGNIGNLGEPAGLYVTHDNGNTIVLITNSGDKTRIGGQFNITRLNFGTSLSNNPVAVNIGNVSNMLEHPRDIVLASFCNETLGFVLNGHPFYNSLLKLNYNNDINSFPTALEMGNLNGFDYPNSICGFFKEGSSLIALVVNRMNSSVTRLVFQDCSNASIPGSIAENPAAISYNQPGLYNIQMLVDEGMPSEISMCKQVLVTSCVDTLIITNDTTICSGTPLQIQTHPAISYQWTPSTYLDDPTSPSPVATPTQNIKYVVDAMTMGDNLVTNGDFSSGNTGFNSGYQFTGTNVVEGEYFVAKDPKTWNISLDYCSDHTGGGNMLLVNGSPAAGKIVWSQTITVKPNTDYAFSSWVQSMWTPNPANLQFSINGTAVGAAASAPSTTCNWTQIYNLWNSRGNTSVTLSIIDLNTLVVGNDFALDDISFAEVIPVHDSISISVKQAYIKANEDTTICAGSPVQLNVAQGAFFTWSPVTGLSNNGVPNPIATPEVTTEYIVVGVDPGGCLARDTVLITVNPSPLVSITNDTAICNGATIQLNATGVGTYQWSPAIGLDNATIANPVANVSKDITYKVRVTGANTCFREDSVKIDVRDRPEFSASGPQAVCAGEPATFIASGGDVYRWTPAANIPDPSLSTITFTPVQSAIYKVNISETVCAYDTTIQLVLAVNPVPAMSVVKSNDVNCTTPAANLIASGAANYSWTPVTGLNNAAIANPIATPDTSTTYSVSGTNEFNCTSTASVVVEVDKTGAPRFVVPNAFTPNNDGKNDCFGIERWGNAVIKQFSIYNRWGTLIFQASDPSQCWDGTWNGKPQNAGGYVYIIKATTLCGDVTRKGLLTLIR